MNRTAIRSALARNRLLAEFDFDQLAREADVHQRRIEQTLVARGIVSREQLNNLIAQELGVPYIDLGSYIFEPEIVKLVPAELARKFKLVPAFRIRDSLTVVMASPDDIAALDELRRVTGLAILPALGNESDIRRALDEQYGREAPNPGVAAGMDGYTTDEISLELANDLDYENAEKLAEQAPVVRYVSEILTRAIQDHASDIHFEPDAQELRVRLRVDGVLRIVSRVPANLAPALASRVKIMAKMDIAERRRPQDGQFETTGESGSIDVRVSSFPTVYGENIVLRLLDKSNVMLGLDELGMAGPVLAELKQMLAQPYGILLVTGPTGSGKTTTLYGALQGLNSEERNIITVEDPVEYHLPLIRQSQVNTKADVTFASGLRAILRQDPDIIMVGEIRDAETAEIAVQAALTGHLVLSTLHTNDAGSAIMRLVDMGVEPFLVASSLLGIIGQRLVRQICPRCRLRVAPTPETLSALSLPSDAELFKGKGCLYCRGTGYRGRTAIFELLSVDDPTRRLTMQRAPSTDITNHAIANGMKTMRDDGIEKALKGITTAEEVVRATRSR